MPIIKINISNAEIYSRIMNGETQSSLSKELGVSRNRISQIYLKEKNKRNMPKDALKELCIEFSETKQQATMVYNSLQRGAMYMHGVPSIKTIDDLKKVSIDSIKKIRNIGDISIGIIEKMIFSLLDPGVEKEIMLYDKCEFLGPIFVTMNIKAGEFTKLIDINEDDNHKNIGWALYFIDMDYAIKVTPEFAAAYMAGEY